MGALLASGPANEIGVVVVTATGKITFWENVENPEAFSLFQRKRYTAIGAIGGMLSGERVSDIVSAKHAGFIVIFNTGRLAHLMLRDARGKADISTQYLRNKAGSESSGFFGGLKMAFGAGSWRADLATVKTRPSNTKSNMNIIAATSQGEFHVWEIDWSGQQEYKGLINAQTEMEAVVMTNTPLDNHAREPTKLVDFAFSDADQQNNEDLANLGATPSLNIMALIERPGKAGPSTFMLVEIALNGTSTHVGRSICCEFAGERKKQTGSQTWPRIYLPSTEDTVVIIFAFTILIVSIVTPELTPESQLLMERHVQHSSQQDVIQLVENEKARIIGCCERPPKGGADEAGLAIFAKGAGLLRLSTSWNGHDLSSDQYKIYTQIEQAIFYGDIPGTLIDFDHVSSADFTMDQIQDAAIEISRNIVQSRVDLIKTKPSMVEQLDERARLLHILALYLKKNFPPLSRLTKWNLLWAAEKVECAREAWSLFEARYCEKGSGHRTNLEIAVACMNEGREEVLNAELGETDEMRTWFSRNIEDFDLIINCAYQAIKQDFDRGNRNAVSVLGMAHEANDIAFTTLDTAFRFRSDSLELYNLEHDALDPDGPDAHFSGFSEDIWTSGFRIISPLKDLVEHSHMVMLKYGEEQLALPAHVDSSSPGPVTELVQVGAGTTNLIRVARKSQRERVKRVAAQGQQQHALVQRMKEDNRKWQRDQVIALQEIELWQEAIKLAREMDDMPLLVRLIEKDSDEHMQYLDLPRLRLEAMGLPVEEIKENRARMSALIGYVRDCFSQIGWRWASPYYHSLIRRGRLGGFLDEALPNEKLATRFLRENAGSYVKLGWINEVLRNGKDPEAGQKDLSRAGDMLTSWAGRSEKNLWSAKVEANIAKLAYMAQDIESNAGTSAQRLDLGPKFEAAASQVKLLKIQERVYAHVAPVSENAIDATAKMELSMHEFARRVIKLGRKGHARTLQACLEKLLRFERLPPLELIELLTLIDVRKCENEDNDISGQECGLALSVLELAGPQVNEILERGWMELIWKRALARDDWKSVNATQGKSDVEVNGLLGKTETIGALKTVTLFDSSSPIKPVSPKECLGAGVDPSTFQFSLADNRLAEQWAHDNAADDELLNNGLDHHRLGYWFERSRVLALEALDQESTLKETARTQEVEEGLALLNEIEGQCTDSTSINGHASAHGSPNGVDQAVNGVEEWYEDEDELVDELVDFMVEEAERVGETEEDAIHDESSGSMQEEQHFQIRSKGDVLESEEAEVQPNLQGGPVVDLTGDDDEEQDAEVDDYAEEDGDEEMDDEYGEEDGEEDEGDAYEGERYEGDGEAGYGEDEDVYMEG